MDHPFDALAKLAAGEMPRRRVLQLALAGAAGAALQPWAGGRRAFAGNPLRTPPSCPPGYSLFAYHPYSYPAPATNGTPSEICVSGTVVHADQITLYGNMLGTKTPVAVTTIVVNGNYARLVVNGRPIYLSGLDQSGSIVTFYGGTGAVQVHGSGSGKAARLNGNLLVYDKSFMPAFLPLGPLDPSCPDGFTFEGTDCVQQIDGGPGGPPVNGTATPELGSGALLATGLAALGVSLYRRRSRGRGAALAASDSAIPDEESARRPSDSER